MTDIVQRLRQSYHLADVAPEHPVRRAVEEIERLRAELALERLARENARLGLDYAQSVPSEPVCPHIRSSGTGEHATNWCSLNGPSAHREAMRLALQSLDDLTRHASSDGPDMKPHRRAADALRAALGDDK